MDITNMNPSIIDLLGTLLRAKGVEVCVDHPSFKRIDEPKPSSAMEKILSTDLILMPSTATVPVSALVFNETSANVSLMATRYGLIPIHPLQGSPVPRGIPEYFPSRAVRNYPIIRDGSPVVTHMPLKASDDAIMVLNAMGFSIEKKDGLAVVDLTKLKNIGSNTKAPSVEEFAQKHYRLLEVQAFCKVFKHYAGETERQAAFEHVYGEAAAKWLAERGVTVNGFSPPGRKHSKHKPNITLECKVKGAAELPSVAEAREKIAAWRSVPRKLAKLPLGVSLMHHALNQIDAFVCSNTYLNPVDRLMIDVGDPRNAAARAHAQDVLFACWARLNYEAADQERRALLREIGQMTFVVLERFREDGATFNNEVLKPNVGLTVPVKADLEGIRATITLKVNEK